MLRLWRAAAATLLCVAVLLVPAGAHASSPQDGPARLDERFQVVAVSPVIVERDLRPGAPTTITVNVANQTAREISFTTGFEDFGPGRTPRQDKRFHGDGDAQRGARRWLQVRPATFRLRPYAERDLQVSVLPPRGVSPGGHYAALFVQAEPPPGGVVAIQSRVAVLLLLTVDGAVERDLRVSVRPLDRLVLGDSLTYRVTLRNRGTVHENVSGRLRIDPWISGAASRAMRPAIVLPGGTREVDVRVPLRSAPDVLDARLRWDVAAEDAPSPDRRAARVLVVPWWVLVAMGVLVVFAAVRRAWRRRHDDAEMLSNP